MKEYILVAALLLSGSFMAQNQSDSAKPFQDTIPSLQQYLQSNQDFSKDQDKNWLSHWIDILTFKVKHRNAVTLNYGMSYDPSNDIDFLMLTYHQVYDYPDVARHNAPENLKFKLEYALGLRTRIEERIVLSFGFSAMYFLSEFETDRFRPFVDAGVGLIYTDFQNEDQGLRINFNPQCSVGTEIKTKDGKPFYLAIRAHHISNGGLHKDNRGINSVFIIFGKYF